MKMLKSPSQNRKGKICLHQPDETTLQIFCFTQPVSIRNKIRFLFNTNVKSVSQFFHMGQKLALSVCVSRKRFQTGCRLSSKTATFAGWLARSILKIKWPADRPKRINKKKLCLRKNQPRADRVANMKKKMEMDGSGIHLRKPSNDISRNAGHHSSGIRMESDEWVVGARVPWRRSFVEDEEMRDYSQS
uniref:Uncharacterized protein n=1 Tax=Trichobilharzia regenti TaxID=157069 RepID=A0AA85IWJ7_TRIRE|nr:unnamed protein product [Trichobilharzia regenti]